MTQLPATLAVQPRPASFALSEIAISAGSAGQDLNLCFDGFEAPVLCEMWKLLTRRLPTNTVFHVRTQADVKKVSERIGEPFD